MAFTLGILIFYRFLFLVLILESIAALPWLTRRDMTWGDSPWQGIIDGGAAGLGALDQFWNQLIIPSTETGNPPDQIQSQPETTNTPEWLTPPILGPNMMGLCPASTHPVGAPDDHPWGGGNILTPDGPILGPNGEYVQQDINTG